MSVDFQVATEEDGRLLSARIADEIRSAVLSGEMRPGMRIRQELLAAKFGASRIPVREALKQLENEGLVVLAPNRGAWIADVNSEESIEVYKIREVVEPLAIFESVPYLTDADISALDAMINELERVTTLEEVSSARPGVPPAHLFARAHAAASGRWWSASGTARSISGGNS